MRKILVTSALAYANGPLHLGHILEQIQTDIWVRFQKLQGNNCIYICGDDAHGTPIMISAQKQNKTPEQLIAEIKIPHEKDSQDFLIDFDNYHTTHSQENREVTNLIYQQLQKNNDIEIRVTQQAFDEDAKMFLPDRYIKGTCPKCGAKEQYGDNCENCGATYSPIDLIDPISIISGKPPIQKTSEHYFFRLNKYTDFLKNWGEKSLQPEIIHKLKEWFTQGLKPWDISRDEPYFGFEIPDKPKKYFYVWLDAPIGYIASLKNLCSRKKIDCDEYWGNNSATELYHFVGKDIIYFHALFWPAILESAKFRKPTAIFTHGYLTINGQKMSKSRNTFILARKYLDYLNPEYLRYYFAVKLNSGIDDIDLNFDDFVKRNNSDLVGKVINIASRSASFINKNFNSLLSNNLDNHELFTTGIKLTEKIRELYENRNFSNAMRSIMQLADITNQYIDDKKPWNLSKENPQNLAIQNSCTMGINMFRLLIILLKPVLPILASNSEKFLQINPLTWEDYKTPLLQHKIGEFKPLLQRIDHKTIERILL
ncbi:MAG: methionine--tRNA ligase [Coxiellaceae bacterium]|jgi:methionyl-tRNA synthetase|nr:methionine--tRNA ligase [Coxiellaceae bacterium]